MNSDMLDLFIYYVNEREDVQANREEGLPKPWTLDPILQHHHFCHNRREDDRGTKEIRAAVRDYLCEVSSLPWVYTMARLFNHHLTVRTWLSEGGEAVKLNRDVGCKIFNTAYVVSTCGERMDKVDYVVRVVHAVAKLDVPRTSCRDAFETLRTVPGLGSFLAGQVVADLKNDRYLADAEDWHTFAVMGPGSKKGLDFIFGPGTTERSFAARLDLLQKVTSGKIPLLHAQDLQNTLCEFSKFVRYKENLPGRRRSYNAHSGKA
jgi:hypothetical protein